MAQKQQFLGVEAIFASPAMLTLFDQVRKVAQSDASVLLVGESGSGKEIVARALHHYSPRQYKPFVDFSCGALPEDLIDAELFGQERGAVPGADSSNRGLFELANDGSIFLSEIGALGPRLQAKLLRLLDTGAFYRSGAVRQTRVNVRIIAAAGAPLLGATAGGGFRSDLYHRLSQISITVPALRERPEDIEALAAHFLAQQNPEMRFASDAIMALYAYHWPGNVRELRNTILQSALMAKGPLLHADDILFTLPPPSAAGDPTREFGIAGLEQTMIRRALEASGGHRRRAAESLGISLSSLSRKIRSFGLSVPAATQRRHA